MSTDAGGKIESSKQAPTDPISTSSPPPTGPPAPPAPPVAPPAPPDGPPKLPPPWSFGKQLFWGCVALLLWLHVFSAGLLIDSMPSRINLGWKATDPAKAQIAKLQQRIEALENPQQVVVNKNPEGGGDLKLPDQNQTSEEIRDKKDASNLDALTQAEKKQRAKRPKREAKVSQWESYFLATLTFMPVNVALLTVLAAFLGGCSGSPQFVRDIWDRLIRGTGSGASEEEMRSRYNYLNEHPAFSAFRGLIVYLVIASGLFVFAGSESFTSEPDQTDSLTRYIRYAGIFSVFGYLAGHDPTVFTSLLRIVGKRVQSPSPEKPK